MRISEGIAYSLGNTFFVFLQDQFSLRPISTREVVDLEELPDSDLQNRSSLPISMPEVVDLDELPDSDLDTGLACLEQGNLAIHSDRIIKFTNLPLVEIDRILL